MIIYAFTGVISLPVIIGGVCIYKYYKYKNENNGYIPPEMEFIDILFS